ncbi:MAG: tRNA (adenosine(37)-N6)-dimethylallyltransferase MiaA [Armatimonadota bacterium]|nr:tRNA (adenosine(37)-N6)-dimethylallyltransferase MiaA [Armatimonadota bacterium]
MTGGAPTIPLLVIAGPTAAGKTEMSLRVAQRVGGEIVSADSMQIYTGMDIGTAKPTAEERARAPIHLIDFIPPDGEYTVVDFTRDAERAILDIHHRGRLPILSGGTGLYLRALAEGFDFPPGPEDEEVRQRLHAEAEEVGSEALHARLAEVDPAAAQRIEPGDARRIVRALEVWELTGEPISAQQDVDAHGGNHYNCAKYVLTAPRGVLFERIERRIDEMMEAGWLDEVRRLADSGVTSDCQSMQAIGYRHLLQHLSGERDLDETVRLIKRDTRRYAKRQMTWLRSGEGYRWLSMGGDRQRGACAEMLVTAARRLAEREG